MKQRPMIVLDSASPDIPEFSYLQGVSVLKSSHSDASLSPKRIDSLVTKCLAFKGKVSVSRTNLKVSKIRNQKLLQRAQHCARKPVGTWRKLDEYSSKRDDIMDTLEDQGQLQVEREALLVSRMMGVGECEKNGRVEPISYKDMLTSRMRELMSLNKRDFGGLATDVEVRLRKNERRKVKKKPKHKATYDEAMLRRDIMKMRNQEWKLPHIKLPALSPVSVESLPLLETPRFDNLSPLNQFIFKQRRKFQPKGSLPTHRTLLSL